MVEAYGAGPLDDIRSNWGDDVADATKERASKAIDNMIRNLNKTDTKLKNGVITGGLMLT